MRIQYNGKSKILIRLAELVNQKADAEDLEQTAADLQKAAGPAPQGSSSPSWMPAAVTSARWWATVILK